MRLLVTRPLVDAHGTVLALEALGHTVSLEPLLRIDPLSEAAIADKPYQAVLVTSANAVRALAHRPEAARLSDTHVLAVGAASGRAAMAAGFTRVENAAGDLTALSALVGKRCNPGAGPLLYAAGRVVSGDLKGLLEAQGYEVDRAVLYDAVEVDALSPETVARLRDGGIDGVLLYSPRSARIWNRVVEQAALRENTTSLAHFCLSQAVADALRGAPGWSDAAIRVASEPNEQTLVDLI